MLDLIDRAELLKNLDYVCTGAGLWSNILVDVLEDCKKFIEHEHAVDAVPVVRCKECNWRDDRWCNLHNNGIFADDDFCSYGSRKDGGHCDEQ